MSCWDHIFNDWLYDKAEVFDVTICRVNLDDRKVEDYTLNEAMERYYERRHRKHE